MFGTRGTNKVLVCSTYLMVLIMADNDAARAQARDEAYKDVKMYLANDWSLKEETPEYFLLERRESSTLIHIILFCLTFGVGNVIYYFLSKKTKKILK
jgi:hypothetical protein